LATIAALVLFSGCGGGSGNPGLSAPRARGLVGLGLSRVVSARQGAFRTVIPLGFSYNPYQAQYDIEGTGALAGTEVVAIRESVQLGDINAWVRRTVDATRRIPRIHRVSRPSALTVAGEPALALDYTAREKGEESAYRQIFVRHGQFVYIIRGAWPAAQRAPASAALEQILSSWQWQ
jgi:hypothetical protein